jgi:DNA-directed RNA polymerase subunit omega
MAEEKDMSYIPMEDLLEKVDSRYKLVILASRRAVELNDGGQRLIDISPKAKSSTIALEEIRRGRISYKKSASKE